MQIDVVSFVYQSTHGSDWYGACEDCKKNAPTIFVYRKIIKHGPFDPPMPKDIFHSTSGSFLCETCARSQAPDVWFNGPRPRETTIEKTFYLYKSIRK